MSLATRILVPTDFSTSAYRAWQEARHLAAAFGAELHLLHVLGMPDGVTETDAIPGKEAFYRHLEHTAHAMLAHLTDRVRATSEIPVQYAVRRDVAPASAILDYVAVHDVDLIVLGTHGSQGGERFLIGSTAEKVVRFAPCTVLTLGPAAEPTAAQVHRILVPIDFSEMAWPVFQYARALAGNFEAHLFLLHAIEPRQHPGGYPDDPPNSDRGVTSLEAHLREAFTHLLAQDQEPPIRTVSHIVWGRPASTLVAWAARHGIDLIVQGARGLAGAQVLPLGHVASEVIWSAPCPVFTVKAARRNALPRQAIRRHLLQVPSPSILAERAVAQGGATDVYQGMGW